MVEFGYVVEDGKIGIATRPDGVFEAGFPSLAKSVHGLGFFDEATIGASGVVENGSFVGAQSHGQVGFAHGIFGAIQSGVIAAQENTGTSILGNLLEMIFQCRNAAQENITHDLGFAEGTEGIYDGDINVVVLAAGLEGDLDEFAYFLIAAGGKKSAAEQVIGAFAVFFAFDGFLNHANGFVMKFRGVEDPRLADLDFRQIPPQGDGAARRVAGGRGACFALEALDKLRILGHFGGKKFDGDFASEAGVFRFVDDAHATTADFAGDFVVGEDLANERAGFRHGREWHDSDGGGSSKAVSL